jgi:hypothetical protein
MTVRSCGRWRGAASQKCFSKSSGVEHRPRGAVEQCRNNSDCRGRWRWRGGPPRTLVHCRPRRERCRSAASNAPQRRVQSCATAALEGAAKSEDGDEGGRRSVTAAKCSTFVLRSTVRTERCRASYAAVLS